MPLNFSGRHFPTDIIMQALRYYLAYKLSYREIEEVFTERNVRFDHSTLNRWVIQYAPLLKAVFRKKKHRVSGSWRMDEAYIKIKGRWVYYLFMIEVLAIKYLDNIVKQSYRKVKGKTHQCLGWKSWEGAESTLAGVELWSMIKQGQMNTTEKMTPWEQFYYLAT